MTAPLREIVCFGGVAELDLPLVWKSDEQEPLAAVLECGHPKVIRARKLPRRSHCHLCLVRP